MEYRIEKLDKKHIDGIMEIDSFCFDVPWSRESFVKELDNPVAFYFVAVNDDRVLGYGGMWWSFDTCEITNIAVHPDFRRKGIAQDVLNHMVELCKEYGVTYLNLDVKVSNENAQKLYVKNGFEKVGIRKRYYGNGEDAVLMTKEI